MSKTTDHCVTFISSETTVKPNVDGFDLGSYTYEATYMIDGKVVKYRVITRGGDIDYVNPRDLVGYFKVNGIVPDDIVFIDGNDLETLCGLCSCREASAKLTML